MPVEKFMARTISTLAAPAEGHVEYFDEKILGFGLRVSSKGRRTWFVRYRIRGYENNGCLTLGTFPNLDLAGARERARAALRLAEDGKDPAAPIQQIRSAELFRDVAAAFMAMFREHHRSWRDKQRILDHDILPAIGGKKATGITRADVRHMLATVVERDSPIMANAVLSLTRRVFNWAIAEEIGGVTSNPCAQLPQPGRNIPRDRVLNLAEITKLWHALDRPNPNVPAKLALALKLQLATGQRKGEVITAEWSEIELDGEAVWTIPANKAKNGLAHRVPLSLLAVELLRQARKLGRNSPWVFPSARKLGHAVTPRAINKAFDAAITGIGLANTSGSRPPNTSRRLGMFWVKSISIRPRTMTSARKTHTGALSNSCNRPHFDIIGGWRRRSYP